MSEYPASETTKLAAARALIAAFMAQELKRNPAGTPEVIRESLLAIGRYAGLDEEKTFEAVGENLLESFGVAPSRAR